MDPRKERAWRSMRPRRFSLPLLTVLLIFGASPALAEHMSQGVDREMNITKEAQRYGIVHTLRASGCNFYLQFQPYVVFNSTPPFEQSVREGNEGVSLDLECPGDKNVFYKLGTLRKNGTFDYPAHPTGDYAPLTPAEVRRLQDLSVRMISTRK